MTEVDGLVQELIRLRRGWGIRLVNPMRVGPRLRQVCLITDDDDAATVGYRVREHLSAALLALPGEPQVAMQIGLCLHSEAEFERLEARIDWLARRLGVSYRTAHRRVDDATKMLAVRIWEDYSTPKPKPKSDEGWYVELLSTALFLNEDRPRALERRIIVATEDGVEAIFTSVSVPRHRNDANPDHELDVEVLYGGSISQRQRPFESVFQQVVELPNSLRAGDKHEYLMQRSLPKGQLMAPHYVHVPLQRRIDHFDLRIRFDLASLPDLVWVINEVPTSVVDDLCPTAGIIKPDHLGEVRAEFRNLKQGFGYGICWRNSDNGQPSAQA